MPPDYVTCCGVSNRKTALPKKIGGREGVNMRKNPNVCRPVRIERHFTKFAEGSVLIKQGDTHVLCTASVEAKVPPFLRGSGRGWVTAEYSMLPRSTSTRTEREIRKGRPDARASEISRLVGRALRAAVDMDALASTRSPWIATCCRRMAARAVPPSLAAWWRWWMRSTGWSRRR